MKLDPRGAPSHCVNRCIRMGLPTCDCQDGDRCRHRERRRERRADVGDVLAEPSSRRRRSAQARPIEASEELECQFGGESSG
jgi:hypothetical protein